MSTLLLKDLVGLSLSEHWVIVSANDRSEGATESLNSYGFIAQHNDGKLGFVKVLNPSFSPEIEGMEWQYAQLVKSINCRTPSRQKRYEDSSSEFRKSSLMKTCIYLDNHREAGH